MERNIKYVFGPHKKPLSPLLCLLYLSYTSGPIYGHIYGRFSLRLQTRKLLALWHEGQKIEGKYLKRAINKMLASWGRRYKTGRNRQPLLHFKREKISTRSNLERSFTSLWSAREGLLSRQTPMLWEESLIWDWEKFKLPVNTNLLPASLPTCPFTVYKLTQQTCEKFCFPKAKTDL